MPISLSRDYPELPYNERLQRFHSKYWTVDYNAEMVGVILPINDSSFRVSAQWRTNKDFLGVRWQSRDLYSHDCYAYATAVDYSDTVLAFRANPSEPNKFTCTVVDFEMGRTYRLAPYVLNTVTGMYECLEPQYGTGRVYPAWVMKPQNQWTPIPDEEMEPWLGRTDYIFILDFNDLRTSANYNGDKVSPKNLSQISFDTVEITSGLGRDSNIIEMVQHSPTEIRLEIAYAQPGVKLTPGDQLQYTYLTLNPAGGVNPDGSPRTETREGIAVVKSWSGFGTGQITVIADGQTLGTFYRCDALYTRFLQDTSPTAVMDTNKYFCDMTATGNDTFIGLRNYVQPAHSLMMTSGFDDNYPQTPERQIEMVYKLGYRGFWNVYIGMSHYFSAHTGWRDAVTGEFIVMEPLQVMTTVFCGDDQSAAHFTQGVRGQRGVDQYVDSVAAAYNIPKGLVRTINGAVAGTAAERMASQDPTKTDFTQGGGLWWWDLEANVPGPALKWAMAAVGRRNKPSVVVWAIGEQDAASMYYFQDRVPAPSAARHAEALRRIFAYMRAQWGNDLLIEIQGTGWSWDEASGMMPVGSLIYYEVTKNSWGDVRATWLSYKVDPATVNYSLNVLNAAGGVGVIRSIPVPGNVLTNYVIQGNYPVEQSCADFGFLPTVVRMQAVGAGRQTEIFDGVPKVDNSIIQRCVVFGGQMNATAHFSELSGGDARPDHVSAGALRNNLADRLGLSRIRVMPVNGTVAYSSADKMAAPADQPNNWWWDVDAGVPGPALTAFLALCQGLGTPVTEIVWAQGETDLNGFTAGNSSAARFKAATQAIFARIRTALGLPSLKIWMQPLARAFFGDDKAETLKDAYQAYRDAQKQIAQADANVMIGSWVSGGGDPANYVELGGAWLNYKPAVYQATALELAESIATGYDRINDQPDWGRDLIVHNLQGKREANDDLTFTWDLEAGRTYRVTNYNVSDGAVISTTDVTVASWQFTHAQQVAVYGFGVSFVNVHVQIVSSGTLGPASIYNGSI